MATEFQYLLFNYNYFVFTASILTTYLGFVYAIETKRLKIKQKHHTLMYWSPALIGAALGYFFVIAPSLWDQIAGGVFAYGIFLAISRSIFRDVIRRLLEPEAIGTPIEKLKLNDDMTSMLQDAPVVTLEDLVEANIGEIADNTHLSAETIIDLRERARRILKSKRKSK